MRNFFEGVRIAEQQLCDFLATHGIDVSAREAAFALAVALTLICAIATIISGGTITGKNILLGKEYGKYSFGKARVKLIFFIIAIIFAALTFFVFFIDGLANFANIAMFFSYLKAIFLCIIIEVVALFVGALIGGSNEIKRDEECKHEINAILSDNPVYVDALTLIKNDHEIKMVVFFRDGISFYNSVNLPSDNGKEEISYYDKEFPEKEKNKALATLGSVSCSLSKSQIKFSDYGYQNSESAMQDLYKCIFEATSPRFKKLEYKREWVYREFGSTSGPTGAIVDGDKVTFTGYSFDPGKIERSGKILLSCILYDDSWGKDEVNSLKEW